MWGNNDKFNLDLWVVCFWVLNVVMMCDRKIIWDTRLSIAWVGCTSGNVLKISFTLLFHINDLLRGGQLICSHIELQKYHCKFTFPLFQFFKPKNWKFTSSQISKHDEKCFLLLLWFVILNIRFQKMMTSVFLFWYAILNIRYWEGYNSGCHSFAVLLLRPNVLLFWWIVVSVMGLECFCHELNKKKNI